MAEINKDVIFTDISTNTPISFDWNFGDGTVLTGITENPVTHQYTTPGDYTVTHSVTNTCGITTCTPKTIDVVAELPSGGGSSAIMIMAVAAIGFMMMVKK